MYIPIIPTPGPLDAALYRKRIGAAGHADSPRDLLDHLHQRHLLSIPFETLDHADARTPSLDIPTIHEKIVRGRRGGDSFELGLLFGWLLGELGYDFEFRAGAVDDAGVPALLLAVELDGAPLLVDVGFTTGLVTPVALRGGAATTTRDAEIRLIDGEKESLVLERIQPEARTRVIRIAPSPLDEAGILRLHREFTSSIAGREAEAAILTDAGFARLDGTELALPHRAVRTIAENEIPYYLDNLFEIEMDSDTWGRQGDLAR